MTDANEQYLREHDDKECAVAERDARIDDATDYAVSEISASELQSVFDEIDVAAVDIESFDSETPEDKFHDLMLIVRRNSGKKDEDDMNAIGHLFTQAVWRYMKEYEIEPLWED